ncbi:hypothetical protein COOONC_03165 [Cooperia oncophora]
MTTTHATTTIEVQSVPPTASGPTHRGKKNKLHRQIHSMSSSEDELPSTSTGFGEEEVQRVPNECTSEKDLLRYIYGSDKVKNRPGATVVRHPVDETRPSTQHHEPPSAPIIPGDMLAAKIRTYLSVSLSDIDQFRLKIITLFLSIL